MKIYILGYWIIVYMQYFYTNVNPRCNFEKHLHILSLEIKSFVIIFNSVNHWMLKHNRF